MYTQSSTNTIDGSSVYNVLYGATLGTEKSLITIKDSATGKAVNLLDIPDYDKRLRLEHNSAKIPCNQTYPYSMIDNGTHTFTLSTIENSNITLEVDPITITFVNGSYQKQ